MKQRPEHEVPADSAHGTVDLAGAQRCIEEGRALVVPAPYPLTSFLMATRPDAARNATGDGVPLCLVKPSG
ncbi:hypothetical protein ABZV67_33365 [Streptomyces sp. NPDC005065]|uniref:hypothetical protein n=1 Tax=Streptomyces sp. NPDC005065 TaxID=3154461 RepID=UPI0033BC6FA6